MAIPFGVGAGLISAGLYVKLRPESAEEGQSESLIEKNGSFVKAKVSA